jgi:hypothetical protein
VRNGENGMTKHPFELAADALEIEAKLPKNRKFQHAYNLTIEHLRAQAAALKAKGNYGAPQ